MKETEQQFLEDLAAEAAQEIHRAEESGRGADAESVIRSIVEREKEFGIKFSRFRRNVLQKAEELRAKAKDEREKRIIKKYEDQVTVAGDKLRPAGIQEEFGVRVWAWTGSLGERVFGHKIDADGLNDLMQKIQMIEDRMERNKVQLAQLKAARDATATLIGPEWLPEGLKGALSFRKAGLVNQIYEAKRKAHGGWGSRFKHLAESYTAAGEIRLRREQEYQRGRKEAFAELKEEATDLKKKKAILDKVMERVRKLQEDGRAVFENAFGDELKVLVEGRQTLGEAEFERRIKKMRDDTAKFGKDAGFVRLDHFLQKSLEEKGIKLGRIFGRPGEYTEPGTGVEKNREELRIGGWWKDVFMKEPTRGEVQSLIDALRKKDPGFLKIFSAEGYKPKETPGKIINMTLRFLMTGKINDREILPPGRRAALNAENIVGFLDAARDASRITGGEDGLRRAMERFVLERTSGASDFINAIEEFAHGEPHPEGAAERHGQIAPVWENLTGLKLDENESSAAFDAIAERYGAGAAMFIESLKTVPADHRDFMRSFYTGKFGNVSQMKMEGLLFRRDDPKGFLDLFEKTEELFRDGGPKRQELQKISALLWKEARGGESGNKRDLPALLRDNDSLLKDMLEEVRKPEEKEKNDAGNVIRVEFGKANEPKSSSNQP